MARRISLWGIFPLVTCIVSGLLMGTIFESKWVLLVTIAILGILAIEGGIELATVDMEPSKKPAIVLNVFCWIIALPLTKYVSWVLASVNSDIHIVLYALMLAGAAIAVGILAYYMKIVVDNIRKLETGDYDDDDD